MGERVSEHEFREYRSTDPQFPDDEQGERWYTARRTAVDTILAAIAGSPHARSLVLRGSVLLRVWFGRAAREPGDLDFVVVPADWDIDEPRTADLLDGIARAAGELSQGRDVRIIAEGAVTDQIWTYGSVPGRRLLLPWEGPDELPGGWIQLDFVFSEHLPLEPEPTAIPRSASADAAGSPGEPEPILLAASRELSLVWKIMWLVTEEYPRGKDLFDAVLLAQDTPLRLDVLREALEDTEDYDEANPVSLDQIAQLDPDWDDFVVEYPGLVGDGQTGEDFVRRLTVALAPAFVPGTDHGIGLYEASLELLALQIEAYQEALGDVDLTTEAGQRAAVEKLVRDDTAPNAAIVILRELLGSDRTSVDEAFQLLYQDPVWALRWQDRADDPLSGTWLAALGVTEAAYPGLGRRRS